MAKIAEQYAYKYKFNVHIQPLDVRTPMITIEDAVDMEIMNSDSDAILRIITKDSNYFYPTRVLSSWIATKVKEQEGESNAI